MWKDVRCVRGAVNAVRAQDAARGRYYYLPNASEKAIAQAASGAMADAKAM